VWEHYEHYFIVQHQKDGPIEAIGDYKIVDTGRNFFKFLTNFVESFVIFCKEKPDIVVTTGAGAAFSTIIIAKLFRKKIVYIESVCRTEAPSFFGRLVYPLVDYTLIQWPKLKQYFPNAILTGNLFDLIDINPISKSKDFIFITVGKHYQGFDRLFEQVDRLIEKGEIKGKVIAQIGSTKYIPKKFTYFNFLPSGKYKYLRNNCRVLITHGGVGCIIEGLLNGKLPIVVPRRKKFMEHNNDHQLEITKILEKQEKIIPVYDISRLGDAINRAKTFIPGNNLAVGTGENISILMTLKNIIEMMKNEIADS